MADEVLLQGVSGITNLITTPGLINTDFADVKMVLSNAGSALMGIGQASGEDRAVTAAKAAISSPLLEAAIDGARGILLNITGPSSMGLFEMNAAAEIIHGVAHEDANIIFGTVIDDEMGDEVKVTVIAAGFDGWTETSAARDLPTTISELFAEDDRRPARRRRRRRLRRPVVPVQPSTPTRSHRVVIKHQGSVAALGPLHLPGDRRRSRCSPSPRASARRGTAAIAAGCDAIGENYAQELVAKRVRGRRRVACTSSAGCSRTRSARCRRWSRLETVDRGRS